MLNQSQNYTISDKKRKANINGRLVWHQCLVVRLYTASLPREESIFVKMS